MDSNIRAAFERYRDRLYDDSNEDMEQHDDDSKLLARAYVELMSRRETALEQGEFHAPTRAWFEWFIASLRISLDSTNETRLAMHESRKQEIYLLIQDEMRLADLIATLEGWRAKFEACGAFDATAPIIDETLTLNPAHADLRGEYSDISLLLADSDRDEDDPELEFGKRYRIRIEEVV